MKQTFPLSIVISVTSGRLCCDIDEVYRILNFVTGDNLFTHVLPRANRFAEPLIKADYPELATVTDYHTDKLSDAINTAKPSVNAIEQAVDEWLKWLQAECNLKPEYELTSRKELWEAKDPLAELQQIAGDRPVIVVNTP